MLVSDLKPGMTAVFGTAECLITAVEPADPIHTRVGYDTTNGHGWMVLRNDAQAPQIKEN